MGLSLFFKVAKMAASTQLVYKVANEVNKMVPAKTRKKISKTFGEVQAKTEEVAILGLEKLAPETVKKLTERNAPKAATVSDIEKALRAVLDEKAGNQKTARKAGVKKDRSL